MIRTITCIFLSLVTVFWTPALYAGGFCGRKVICKQPVVQRFNVVDRVDVLQKRVEFDAEYFLGLNGYYDVVNELQQREYTKDKDIILKQTEQIDKLISLLEELIHNREQPNPQPEPQPQPQPDPQPEPPVAPKPIDSRVELNSKVFDIFSNRCYSCHGPNSPKAGLQLVGEDENGVKWLNDLSLEDRVLVYDVVANVNLRERGKKLMPLGGPQLDAHEIELLRLWMIDKAEQLKAQAKELRARYEND